MFVSFFFQAEDGIRDLVRSRGLGDVYKRQSLHCAYIAYIALVSLGAWGSKAWWVLLWVGVVSFSTVYLGHHWVIDILAGYFFAVDACLLAWLGRRILLKRQALKGLPAA